MSGMDYERLVRLIEAVWGEHRGERLATATARRLATEIESDGFKGPAEITALRTEHDAELEKFAQSSVEAWSQRDYYLESNRKLAAEINALRAVIAQARELGEGSR